MKELFNTLFVQVADVSHQIDLKNCNWWKNWERESETDGIDYLKTAELELVNDE